MSTHFVILMFLLKLETFITLHKFILEIKQARDICYLDKHILLHIFTQGNKQGKFNLTFAQFYSPFTCNLDLTESVYKMNLPSFCFNDEKENVESFVFSLVSDYNLYISTFN